MYEQRVGQCRWTALNQTALERPKADSQRNTVHHRCARCPKTFLHRCITAKLSKLRLSSAKTRSSLGLHIIPFPPPSEQPHISSRRFEPEAARSTTSAPAQMAGKKNPPKNHKSDWKYSFEKKTCGHHTSLGESGWEEEEEEPLPASLPRTGSVLASVILLKSTSSSCCCCCLHI